ncbi:hypothetical protein OROMI_022968 [Orobanche minor]
MNPNKNNESKSDMQYHQIVIDDEVIASFEKALKEAKEFLEKAHYLALEINDVLKLSNQYVSDSDVEDGVPRTSTPSVRRAVTKVEDKTSVDFEAAIKVEEKPSISENAEDSTTKMLRILLPDYFEIK